MKKKVTAIALAVCILAVAVIGATMAYFTDTDSKTNTFTFGKVDIDLTETSTAAGDGTVKDGELITDGNGNVTGIDYGKVLPGLVYSKVPEVTVVEGPAWVVVTVTVPTIYDHADFFNGTANERDFVMEKKVVGKNTIYYFYSKDADGVAANTSLELFEQIKINPALTQDDVKNLRAFDVVVNAYGIQKEGFDNAQEAFAKAFADKLPTASVVIDGKAVGFDSLTDAIAKAPAGATVTLEKDLVLENDLRINKDLTLQGEGQIKFVTKKSVWVDNSANLTFKNLHFANAQSPEKQATSIYAKDYAGKLVVDGCKFTDPQWEFIQVTPKNGAEITVSNCEFNVTEKAAYLYYGATEETAGVHRMVHIENTTSQKINAKVTITNNVFSGCDKCTNAVIDVDEIELANITVGGNTFDTALNDKMVYVYDHAHTSTYLKNSVEKFAGTVGVLGDAAAEWY